MIIILTLPTDTEAVKIGDNNVLEAKGMPAGTASSSSILHNLLSNIL